MKSNKDTKEMQGASLLILYYLIYLSEECLRLEIRSNNLDEIIKTITNDPNNIASKYSLGDLIMISDQNYQGMLKFNEELYDLSGFLRSMNRNNKINNILN